DDLTFVGTRAPLRRIPGNGDDVLAAPRNAVQRPAVLARRDLAVRLLRLMQGEVVGEGDDEVQQRVVAVKPIETHARQLDRRDLARFDEMSEVRDRPERRVFEISWTPQRARRTRAERTRRPIEPRAGNERTVVER